jgi:hypothetical protein
MKRITRENAPKRFRPQPASEVAVSLGEKFVETEDGASDIYEEEL